MGCQWWLRTRCDWQGLLGRSPVKDSNILNYAQQNTLPMSDLVRPDPRIYVSFFRMDHRRVEDLTSCSQGARVFNGPDGLQYRWRPSQNGADVVVSFQNVA